MQYLKGLVMKQVTFKYFILLLISLSTYSIQAAGSLPITGDKNPQFTAFDTALLKFMGDRGFEAGVAAISRDNSIIHKIGIGWNDPEKKQPINPDIRMRIASITKGMTKAAIYKLYNQSGLPPEGNSFWQNFNFNIAALFGSKINIAKPTFSNKKIWEYTPTGMPEPKDPRVKNISIQQLLDHKGGWDINMLGVDPQFDPQTVQRALNLTGNPTPDDIIYFMLTMRDLQFAPGTRTSYSNFGYNILGRLIEKRSGKDYVTYMKEQFFAPLGINDIDLGYSNKRQSNEIWYPRGNNELYLVEDMDSHGGLISSAGSLVKFFDHYWANGQPREGNGNYYQFGALPTTLAVVYQDGNMTVAILLNNRRDGYENQDLNELLSIIKRTIFNK